MKVTRRKSVPMRSPSASIPLPSQSPKNENGISLNEIKQDWQNSPAALHDRAPATFGTPALQSLIYATSNDRYPGAPGTLLYKAKLEAARALAAKQREAQREAERREEMKRLGILGMGKKRSTVATNNGVNTNGSNSRFGTPPGNERARRSNPSSSSSSSNNNGTPSNTVNGRTGRGNGRNGNGNSSIDHNSLPTPSSSQQDNKQTNGTGSPLLSSSGRLRRPANGSRGASPMPLTSSNNGTTASTTIANTNGTGMVTRTRSPVVAPVELDDETASKLGPSSLGLTNTTANGVAA